MLFIYNDLSNIYIDNF